VITHGSVRYVLTEVLLRAMPIATAVLFSGGFVSDVPFGWVHPVRTTKIISTEKKRKRIDLFFMLCPSRKSPRISVHGMAFVWWIIRTPVRDGCQVVAPVLGCRHARKQKNQIYCKGF
jgi:hypothetical protein